MSNTTIANKTLIFAMMALAALTLLTGCSDDDPATPGNNSETFTLTIENVSAPADYAISGVFNTPVDASAPAPIFPGEAYEFTLRGQPGRQAELRHHVRPVQRPVLRPGGFRHRPFQRHDPRQW